MVVSAQLYTDICVLEGFTTQDDIFIDQLHKTRHSAKYCLYSRRSTAAAADPVVLLQNHFKITSKWRITGANFYVKLCRLHSNGFLFKIGKSNLLGKVNIKANKKSNDEIAFTLFICLLFGVLFKKNPMV